MNYCDSENMQRDLPARRGFASVTAVVLLGLVAATAGALGALTRVDYVRTRNGAADAQLRQLLLAGAADVLAQSTSWAEKPGASRWDVALPDSTAALRATLAVEVSPTGEGAEARITAKLSGRESIQRIQLAREGDRWRISSSEMERE